MAGERARTHGRTRSRGTRRPTRRVSPRVRGRAGSASSTPTTPSTWRARAETTRRATAAVQERDGVARRSGGRSCRATAAERPGGTSRRRTARRRRAGVRRGPGGVSGVPVFCLARDFINNGAGSAAALAHGPGRAPSTGDGPGRGSEGADRGGVVFSWPRAARTGASRRSRRLRRDSAQPPPDRAEASSGGVGLRRSVTWRSWSGEFFKGVVPAGQKKSEERGGTAASPADSFVHGDGEQKYIRRAWPLRAGNARSRIRGAFVLDSYGDR